MQKTKDALLGLAVGDALGVPVEFSTRNELKRNPVFTMKGYGAHSVPAGSWSDDTSMTIATMDSVAVKGEFVFEDIMANFSKWTNGAFTSTGYMFDIGATCSQAITAYQCGIPPLECGQSYVGNNGNGSLMRCIPVPLYSYLKNKPIDRELSDSLSSLTHKHPISLLGCYMYSLFALDILNGISKEEAYRHIKKADYSMYGSGVRKYSRIINGDISALSEDEISSSGFVASTLEAALWCVLRGSDFKNTVLTAVNLGDDTDTVGACTGALAGILYGADDIPCEWLETLAKGDYLIETAERFVAAL